MAVPSSAIGTSLPTLSTTIERGRLRFFAEAIGETDARYSDLDAARAAGYPDLPVPPTFLFGLKLDLPDPFGWLLGFGVDMRAVLHGTQRFDYDRMVFAGNEVSLQPHLADVYEKRGGALEFVVVETAVTRGDEPVASFTETIVVRHPELEAAR